MGRTTASKPTFPDVVFDFWNSDVNISLIGKVIDRGKQMVIDVPIQKNQGPYLIIGTKAGADCVLERSRLGLGSPLLRLT
jgi:hypothetical protein